MKTVLATTSATLIFTPGTAGTSTLNFRNVATTIDFQINRLIAVVNQTQNQMIYAETVPNFGYTNYNNTTKVLTLQTDTSTHAATDILQVIYDNPTFNVSPAEEYMDPVNKERVSTPQALIDTDFEYGTQSTKWESISLINNRPTCFYDATIPLDPTLITNVEVWGRLVKVSMSNTATIAAGNIIFVQDLLDPAANGWFFVIRVESNSAFYYIAKPTVRETNSGTSATSPYGTTILDTNRSLFFVGSYYTGSNIPVAATAVTTPNNNTTALVTTTNAHGLAVGDSIFINNLRSSPAGQATDPGPPNGAWTIDSVPTTTTFTFTTTGFLAGTTYTNASQTNVLYPRPAGFVIQRPFDGGVQLTCGTAPNAQLARQTRKYFRYQSGKGIQFSTGSIFKPVLNLINLSGSNFTAAGGTNQARNIANNTYTASITAISRSPHGLLPGTMINVTGVNDNAYNGNWEVANVQNENTLTYYVTGSFLSTLQPPSGNIAPGNLYGPKVRIGMFDSQNGLFFENDGIQTYAVKRSSTDQLNGLVQVTQNSGVVTGVTNNIGRQTAFTSQLVPGDFVVIKGMSYRVHSIESDTRMQILPEYRGATTRTVMSKTQDLRIPQSQWNIDRLDGTGPSGYVLDQTRMQMFYVDYSWYGAGFVRWGVRGPNGNVLYFHKLQNNNVNTEAYMRSGNLPARYEEALHPPITFLTSTITTGDFDTLNVRDTSFFPNSGILKVSNPELGGAIEYMSYQAKTPTTFNVLRRALPGGNTSIANGQNFNIGPANNPTLPQAVVNVELAGTVGILSAVNILPAQALSHWGSSVIMDGRFDDDVNFVFNAGHNTTVTPGIAASTENVIMAIRLAPAVDSGRTGVLGSRELINRMALRLRNMDIIANQNCRVTVYLNGRISSTASFSNVGGSSLAQIWLATAGGTTISNGENIFSYFSQANVANQTDLSLVREIGNSVIGGGLTNSVPDTAGNGQQYPDGPDVLYIALRNLNTSTAATFNGRLSWTEAQA